jgi:hypothetical protein
VIILKLSFVPSKHIQDASVRGLWPPGALDRARLNKSVKAQAWQPLPIRVKIVGYTNERFRP